MRALMVLPVVLLLAGCAGAAPVPTPTASANKKVCADFANATNTWLNSINGDTGDDWDAELVRIDEIALQAEGDVKERILTLVSDVPGIGDVFVYKEARDEVNELIAAVERACAADGFAITANKFTN